MNKDILVYLTEDIYLSCVVAMAWSTVRLQMGEWPPDVESS